MDINVIIKSPYARPEDAQLLFGDETVLESEVTELSVLLRELGVYASSSIARRAGRSGPVPLGFSAMKASKIVDIFIWNPSE